MEDVGTCESGLNSVVLANNDDVVRVEKSWEGRSGKSGSGFGSTGREAMMEENGFVRRRRRWN